jgi:hypothetical protein
MDEKQRYRRDASYVLLCAIGIVYQKTGAGKFIVCDR